MPPKGKKHKAKMGNQGKEKMATAAPFPFIAGRPSSEILNPYDHPSGGVFSFDFPSPPASQAFWLPNPATQGHNSSASSSQEKDSEQAAPIAPMSASPSLASGFMSDGQSLPPLSLPPLRPQVSAQDLMDCPSTADVTGTLPGTEPYYQHGFKPMQQGFNPMQPMNQFTDPNNTKLGLLDLKGLAEADYVGSDRLSCVSGSNADQVRPPSTDTPHPLFPLGSGLLSATEIKNHDDTASEASTTIISDLATTAQGAEGSSDELQDAQGIWWSLHGKKDNLERGELDPLSAISTAIEFADAYDQGWRNGPKPSEDAATTADPGEPKAEAKGVQTGDAVSFSQYCVRL